MTLSLGAFTWWGTLIYRASDRAELRSVADADWFPLTAAGDTGPSVIGMESWLEAPAGTHGGVRMVEDRFQFEDGTPVKFWGTNLSFAQSAPEKALGEHTARRFAKYGVNAVRLHKFTGVAWAGIGDLHDATEMHPARLDRLDYFSQQLARRGIYYGWSHSFGFRLRPGNRHQVLAYEEIQRNLGGNTYGLINVAEDLQDLMIAMVVKLLRHPNPYTGKTYAEDPALAFVELQNEDDIFAYATGEVLEKCPSYRAALMARYARWLSSRYGNQEGLALAWGKALKFGERLDQNNIAVQTNPWFLGEDWLPRQNSQERRRLLDGATFLHELQNRFYRRFVAAIRETGYRGPITGSPWMAPSLLPHYLNLKSDYMVGYIDRHNYFGGGLFDSLLSAPGGGYLSSGLQQVEGRPFVLSEWIHVHPSLYGAEGPPAVAAYGLGLQGWDGAYVFQSKQIPGAFAERVGGFPWNLWTADSPGQIGQFPALSRMILRGDVAEGAVLGVRSISEADLAEGRFGFSERVTQSGDLQSTLGSTPQAALAAGRMLVRFTARDEPQLPPELSGLSGPNAIRSNTGQLLWNYRDPAHFTIDTPGTKALVGFTDHRPHSLGAVEMTLHSPYASLFLTSLEKDRDLDHCRSALLSAVARAANTGMTYRASSGQLADNGSGPVLMEPVRAEIRLMGRRISRVTVLDQDGRRTPVSLPVKDGAFSIDTAGEKTFYYELTLE